MNKALSAKYAHQTELRDLTVSTHLSFEIVRDRRLKGPEAKYAPGLSALSVATSHPRSGQKPRV